MKQRKAKSRVWKQKNSYEFFRSKSVGNNEITHDNVHSASNTAFFSYGRQQKSEFEDADCITGIDLRWTMFNIMDFSVFLIWNLTDLIVSNPTPIALFIKKIRPILSYESRQFLLRFYFVGYFIIPHFDKCEIDKLLSKIRSATWQ